MKQIKIFAIPDEVDAMNAFLAINPPEVITPFTDKVVFTYDDGSYPASYKMEECRALIASNTKDIMTHGISMRVSEIDLEFAKGLLATVSAIVVPIDPKTKKPDTGILADKEAKIKEHTLSISGLTNGISNLAEMIRRFATRNQAMEEMIAKIEDSQQPTASSQTSNTSW